MQNVARNFFSRKVKVEGNLHGCPSGVLFVGVGLGDELGFGGGGEFHLRDSCFANLSHVPGLHSKLVTPARFKQARL